MRRTAGATLLDLHSVLVRDKFFNNSLVLVFLFHIVYFLSLFVPFFISPLSMFPNCSGVLRFYATFTVRVPCGSPVRFKTTNGSLSATIR
jgi:hypothetical protein